MDRCVHCHEVLAIMERNRSECWNCQEKMSETYSDDYIEVEDEVKEVVRQNLELKKKKKKQVIF